MKKTLYHKASIAGLTEVLMNFEPGLRLCCSSDDSQELFWRDVVCVLSVDESKIAIHENNDIDARNITPYDECRVMFETGADFLSALQYIIIDGKKLNRIRKGTFKPFAPIHGTLSTPFFRGDHEAAERQGVKAFFEKEINCPVINLTQAKKIKKHWTKNFLNI